MSFIPSPELIDAINARYPNEGYKPIAQDFGLSHTCVRQLARKLGVKADRTATRERISASRRKNTDAKYEKGRVCSSCQTLRPWVEYHSRTSGLCRWCKNEASRANTEKREIPVTERKLCRTCAQEKPAELFYRSRSGRGGLGPDCKECIKFRDMEKRYGLNRAGYQRLWDEQGGCCGICGDPLVRAHVDHCHKTGKVRSLLCDQCNVGLGSFKEDILRFQAAIRYIECHSHETPSPLSLPAA